MNSLFNSRTENRRQRGQSITEFALALPLLLLIIVGALETANFLNFQNRVQQVSREGARFGATGGTDGGISTVVAQSSANLLELDDQRMWVWIIRPVVELDGCATSVCFEGDLTGTGWGDADVHLVFGDDSAGITNPLSAAKVLDQVSSPTFYEAPDGSLDGNRLVVVVVRYETATILNLPFWTAPGQQPDGQVPQWAYTVMNQEIDQETVNRVSSGCSAYPIVLEEQYVVEGTTWTVPRNDLTLTGSGTLKEPSAEPSGYGYTGWRVTYDEPAALINEGVPYYGAFNFPGNSTDLWAGYIEYDPVFASQIPDGLPVQQFNLYDPAYSCDGCDLEMHRGDWVAFNSSDNANALGELKEHMEYKRQLRILVYEYKGDFDASPKVFEDPGGFEYKAELGTTWMYQIKDFVIVRIVAWTKNPDTITFEIIRRDTSCGYDQP